MFVCLQERSLPTYLEEAGVTKDQIRRLEVSDAFCNRTQAGIAANNAKRRRIMPQREVLSLGEAMENERIANEWAVAFGDAGAKDEPDAVQDEPAKKKDDPPPGDSQTDIEEESQIYEESQIS